MALMDKLTLFVPTETNRVKTYTATVIPCQWEPRHGAYRGLQGDTSEYSLEAIVKFEGIHQGDKIEKGSLSTPSDNAFEVVFVDDIYMRGQYHHSEVYAR